jgi:hypothetical protein
VQWGNFFDTNRHANADAIPGADAQPHSNTGANPNPDTNPDSRHVRRRIRGDFQLL